MANVDKIQALFRMYRMKKKIDKLRKKTLLIQSFYRMHEEVVYVQKVKQAVHILLPHLVRFVYHNEVKERKNIRMITMKIITSAGEKILQRQKMLAASKINGAAKSYLFRKNNLSIMKKVKQLKFKRLIVIAALVIQKFYRGYRVFIQFHLLKFCTDYIRSTWKMVKKHKWFQNLRKVSILIQRNLRIFLTKKSALNKLMKNYFDSRYSKKMVDEINTLKKYFNENKNTKNKRAMKKKTNSIDVSCKLSFNIKLHDFDLMNSTDNSYNGEYWIKKYSAVEKFIKMNKEYVNLISLGECHSIILSSKGKSYVFGWNDSNQCVDFKNNENNFTSAIAYDSTTFLLSSTGIIISNNQNTLNLNNINSFETQTPLSQNKFVSLFPSQKTNQCYAIDMKNQFHSIELKTTLSHTRYQIKSQSLVLNKFQYKKIFSKISIHIISCGKNFSMFLSSNGVLYSMGTKNNKGELGLGDFKKRDEPTQIGVFIKNGDRITNVRCGYKHTICLASNGRVFSWGSNSNGQLGLEHFGNYNKPMWIKLDDYGFINEKIISIAAGFRSSFFLSDSRKVYFCGYSGIKYSSSSIIKLIKDISDDTLNENYIVKLCSQWNLSFSIFYITYCDLFNMKNNTIFSPQKAKWILNTMSNLWVNDNNLKPPYIKGISEYI